MKLRSYRYSAARSLAPRVLVSPRVHALLMETGQGVALQAAIAQCIQVAAKPGSKLHAGYSGLGNFELRTIWSDDPAEPDLFVILGPGDGLSYWGPLLDYEEHRDQSLLAGLIPVSLI